MANRYIRQDIERDIYSLKITDIPKFINATLRDEIDRINEKEDKEK